MHRTEGLNNDGGLYTEGPPPTTITAAAMNALQEEIASVIEYSGQSILTAGTDTHNQLLAAVLLLSLQISQLVKTGYELTTDSSYTIDDSDGYDRIILSGASACATFTLPTLADNQSRIIEILNADTTYNLLVDGEGSETISGMASFTILPGHTCKIVALSGEWKILSSSFDVVPVAGTNYAVYTKTFSGNLDADSTTGIAHGVTATKIISVTGSVYEDNSSTYRVFDANDAQSTNQAYVLIYSATNIIFGDVGSYCQGNAYVATIKYYVD